jgi:hypothetical protein
MWIDGLSLVVVSYFLADLDYDSDTVVVAVVVVVVMFVVVVVVVAMMQDHRCVQSFDRFFFPLRSVVAWTPLPRVRNPETLKKEALYYYHGDDGLLLEATSSLRAIVYMM